MIIRTFFSSLAVLCLGMSFTSAPPSCRWRAVNDVVYVECPPPWAPVYRSFVELQPPPSGAATLAWRVLNRLLRPLSGALNVK